MAERFGVAGDLTREPFELAAVSSPWFDFGDSFQGHLERRRGASRFEGQVPAGLGATRTFEGGEAAGF